MKPVPLKLCGKDLPWVESATHLGHELHESGTMEHDAKVARARYINQTVEVRQSFAFASPVEVIRALEVYTTSYYGAMTWDLQGEGAKQLYNSWSTAIKLAWSCPRATRTYLVQQVLSCDSTSARVELLSRYCKFFRSLCNSGSREVSTLARLVARDVRSTTGRNILLISTQSGCNVWEDSFSMIKAKLTEAGISEVEEQNQWRVKYLGVLLAQRQTLHYRGDKENANVVQHSIDSLCIN